MNDVRWFASNSYTGLLVPELRRRGLTIAVEGRTPARLALAMSGTRAEQAWRYAREQQCPLVVYIWDLPPEATGSGSYDPVWSLGPLLVRLPRPSGAYGRRRGYYSRLRYIAARAREVWVPSAMTSELVRTRFGLDSRRVAYCYDSDRFVPGGVPKHEPTTLVTVSRLKVHKNQALTIKAAAMLGEGAGVRLIGRGPERGSLERLAQMLGVRCRIDDDATDSEVVDAYRRASVVVCPSRFEGFGLTPIEALACGTRVVASDIPPHREFVGNSALFFDPGDARGLAEAVRAALRAPAPDPSTVQALSIPETAERFLSCIALHLG